MQAITLAVSSSGIEYFATAVLDPKLTSDVSQMKPPDQTIPVGRVPISQYDEYDDIVVKLTNGGISGFAPAFGTVAQQTGGKFSLPITAPTFSATYTWSESGSELKSSDQISVRVPYDSSFGYAPSVTDFKVAIPLVFQFVSNAWQIDVSTSGITTAATIPPNIPNQSVTHVLGGSCGVSQALQTLDAAIQGIDFSSSVRTLIPPLLDSIPASGNLGNGIVFSFGLGPSGLTFPSSAGVESGIAIGATGSVTWNGKPYSGKLTAPTLPVPLPPTDGHHLQLYAADYVFNELYWAYQSAGLLDATIEAADLPDPAVLHVATYVSAIPALKAYEYDVMQAQLTALAAPTVTFAQVYIVSTAVLAALQTQLPSGVYTDLQKLSGNTFVGASSFETALNAVKIASSYFATIEAAAKSIGAIVTHDLEFTLTILGEPDPKPTIVFSVARTDVLESLALGVAGKAQTLQFAFNEVASTATFISSSIAGFDGTTFAGLIWPVVGDPRYDAALQSMGKTGVPLPIMAGFDFVFRKAALSIQEGYVSVIADVEFNPSTSTSHPTSTFHRSDVPALS